MTTPLSFDDLQGIMHRHLDLLPDHRKTGPNTRYRIQEAALGGHCQLHAKIYTFVQEQEEQGLVGTFIHPWILALQRGAL